MPSDANVARAGLEGIVATQSAISDVNGLEGRLVYRGYDIHDLAEHATFEEVIYLLWNGSLPTSGQLDDLNEQLHRHAPLPAEIKERISRIPKDANPMDMLRTIVSALSFYDPDAADMSREANVRKAIRLTARFSGVVTAFYRFRTGEQPVDPRPDLSLAGNFLYTLWGRLPDEVATRTMD